MTKEQMLAYAIKTYPIGTKISCAYDGEISITKSLPIWGNQDNEAGKEDLIISEEGRMNQVIYWDKENKWAGIVTPVIPNKTEVNIKEDIDIILSKHLREDYNEDEVCTETFDMTEASTEIVQYIKELLK